MHESCTRVGNSTNHLRKGPKPRSERQPQEAGPVWKSSLFMLQGGSPLAHLDFYYVIIRYAKVEKEVFSFHFAKEQRGGLRIAHGRRTTRLYTGDRQTGREDRKREGVREGEREGKVGNSQRRCPRQPRGVPQSSTSGGSSLNASSAACTRGATSNLEIT